MMRRFLWRILYALRLRRRPPYRAVILKMPGLVGYWPLDEGFGSIVYDVSGQGHDGEYR